MKNLIRQYLMVVTIIKTKFHINGVRILPLIAISLIYLPQDCFSQNELTLFSKLEFSGYIDTRAISSSSENSWLNGGLGKLRYGKDESELSIAEASFIIEAQLTWDLSTFIQLQYSPEQTESIDLVEAYLHYTPLSLSSTKYSAKLGFFYPPISLENTDIGWTSPYSLTSSSLNSWIGEEVKALTGEFTIGKRFDSHRFNFLSAVFLGNDTTSALLAWRGWAMHDQKLTLLQRYPLPSTNSLGPGGTFDQAQAHWTEPVHEYDNKLGYYLGLNWDYLGIISLHGLYYNNRANPAKHVNLQYSWDVNFYTFGASASPVENVEIIVQYLSGSTTMGPDTSGEHPFLMDFSSYYLMTSYIHDKHRLSFRYDNFSTTDRNHLAMFIDSDHGKGNSFTLAYAYRPTDNQRVMAELLRIDYDRFNRADVSLPVSANEEQFQISYRFSF